jgi:hypothetical protein
MKSAESTVVGPPNRYGRTSPTPRIIADSSKSILRLKGIKPPEYVF